jgi:hypothetical protein
MKVTSTGFPGASPLFRLARLVFLLWLALAAGPRLGLADSIIVFNEIMYHPPGGAPELEWLELYNQQAVDVDISNWALTRGVTYVFPEGTVARGGGFIVVAASPAALAAASGYSGAHGPFGGRLDDSGERLELRDLNGRLMDSVRYNDAGDWPVAADGSGASLAKLDPDLASAPAKSWTASLRVGGTPGEHNFPAPGAPIAYPEGLISYWNFDETSGRALDLADSNHGTLGTGTVRVAGLVGPGALSFNNTTDAFVNIGIGTGNNFAVTSGITVEAVIVPLWSAALGDHDQIYRKEDGTSRVLLALQHDGNGNGFSEPPLLPGYSGPVLSFGLNVGGAYKELDMPLDGAQGRPTLAQLKDGNPHHITATYDRATGLKAIYVDGVLRFSHQYPAGSAIASGGGSTAYIGNMNGRGEPFTGVLDEVAYWGRALGAAEIAAHHASMLDGQSYFSRTSEIVERPTLAFNEVFVAPGMEPWVEIVNHGGESVQLRDFAIERAGPGGGRHVLAAQSLAPGAYLTRTRTALGFDLLPGDKLFLMTPGRTAAADGVRVTERHRARHPEATGRWLYPDRPTPGAANSFAFRSEFVINEIMYHKRPLPGTPGVIEEDVLVPLDAVWRYDQSGNDLGTAWRDPDFNDSAWPEGRALLYNESGPLPGPKNTLLNLGPITYYFRLAFDFPGDPAGVALSLQAVIDDGAAFYLNGFEIHRFNLAADATASTLASPGVGDAVLTGPYPIAPGALRRGRNVLAVEVHQATANSTDIAFGLILSAPRTLSDKRPFRDSPEAWIELYNRSSTTVDLSGWSFTNGIRYLFEESTRLAPGAYLVLAADKDHMQALYPSLRVAGNYEGRLSHKSDRLVLTDPFGNPAGEVEYFDGGRWPSYADGGGSSLELRDPRADNSKAEAWAASDESGKSRWQTFTYRGVATANVGPTRWNEFVIGLLDEGEILIDDIRVVDSPSGAATQLIQNPTFQSGAGTWRLLGNHGFSSVVPDPDDPGNRVLHVVATGATEHMHNHIETTLVGGTITNGREYEVSFRARWLAGSNQLNTRLYFNRLPRTTLLEIPEKNGTPGARNSVFEANIGPTYSGFTHSPVAPQASELVSVSVTAEDPDGVSGCTLWWSVNGGAWASGPMTHLGGGRFERAIPGQAASSIVQFYVEGRDGQNVTSTYPAAGRDSRALYKVNDGQAVLGRVHNFRIIMTTNDANFLHLDTNVMSNQRMGATVVYDERQAFYNVGVRLKGSERGRPVAGRVGFNVRFDPDHLFRGVHEKVHIDRSGGWSVGGPSGQDEILIKHMVNKAGGIPGMYDDITRVIAPRSAQTGSALLMMARFDDVYLDSQYVNGSDGTMFKLELIYYPTTTADGTPQGLKRPQPDEVLGTDLRDLGDDKEVYRWTFLIENNRKRDDYSRLIDLCKAFSSPGATLEAAAEAVMDVNQWMRTFCVISLAGVNDTYTQGNNHNCVFYVRPADNKVLAFPWDMDFSFTRSTSAPLWGDQNLSRIISLNANRRLFYCHLRDLIEKSFNPTYMTYWANHYGNLAGQNFSSMLTYIGARRSFVLSQLPAQVPFAITTNGGQNFTVDTRTTTIEGDAWFNVKTILLAGQEEPLKLTWVTQSRWRTTVPLKSGANQLQFFAFDLEGNALASARITVTSTTQPIFIRGDMNLDGAVDIADAVRLLLHLFHGAPSTCQDAGDADNNEVLNIADAIYILEHLFRRGPPPPAPYPQPGIDPDGSGPLGCSAGL